MTKISAVMSENLSFLSDQFSCAEYKKIIFNQVFSNKIHIIIPNNRALPQEIADIITSNDCSYMVVEMLPISELINKEFYNLFVNKGKMWAISLHTNAGTSNCAAIVPSGNLILSCTKTTFEKLGVQSKQCCKYSKENIKYEILIDMTKPYFKPEKNNYEQIMRGLQRCEELIFNFALVWHPEDPSISSSSLKDYLINKNYKCHLYNPLGQISLKYSVPIPKIIANRYKETENSCEYKEVLEWIGAEVCNINWNEEMDEHCRIFKFLEHCETVDQLSGSWQGVFTSEAVMKIIEKIQHVLLEDSSIPYVAFVVNGFEDSIFDSNLQNHKCIQSSQKIYSCIIFPSDHYWIYKAIVPYI